MFPLKSTILKDCRDIESIFIGVQNHLICKICLERQLEAKKIIFITKDLEKLFEATELYKEPVKRCIHCERVFNTKYAYDRHHRALDYRKMGIDF